MSCRLARRRWTHFDSNGFFSGSQLPEDVLPGERSAFGSRLRALAALSHLDGFRVMAILLLVAIPFVWIMKKFKSPPQEQAE